MHVRAKAYILQTLRRLTDTLRASILPLWDVRDMYSEADSLKTWELCYEEDHNLIEIFNMYMMY
jgi:hypothetical protein